ncbi:Hypothetical predicted protein [Olea europaea subsp. europaea]|uniref:Uncharacterized protein n=1 Tax=Olea europaea subsp. europaea TaxID=158383 RepID=A0A8S0V9B2_OLEEU|nr:Hypothetical predicted protein [Olea europaea subsp. europaea]
MDHFDERQREDFCNSSLGYLAEVPNIQFSSKLIQQLVFRTIRIDKVWVYEALLEIGKCFAQRVASQFNGSGVDSGDGGQSVRKGFNNEASEGGDEKNEQSGSDRDSEDTKDTSESGGDRSSAGEDTRGGDRDASSSPYPSRVPSPERQSMTHAKVVGTFAPSLTRTDMEKLLLDQRILF